MYLKKISLLLIFCTIGFFAFSQNVYYLDEHFNEIDSITFENKCSTFPYKCLDYSTDSLVVRKVLERFKFGNIGKEGYGQVRMTLSRTTGKPIDSNSVMVISYKDSLYDYTQKHELFLRQQAFHEKKMPESADATSNKPKFDHPNYSKKTFERAQKNISKNVMVVLKNLKP